jgi:hypothetical protein
MKTVTTTTDKQYRIEWRNKTTGQTGRGTKRFERSEALKLARELNHDYPHIEHSTEEVE